MMDPHQLLARLEAIGQSLARSGQALALIGLGSVGQELERLDAYSDLDFFVIVVDGFKARYIENLDWLSAVAPVAYHFRNTVDGHKLLFQDGIFCEFAVFEQAELQAIPFAAGRVVWKQSGIAESIGTPQTRGAAPTPRAPDFLVNEALTNLYVGLGRLRRGEALSAARFIQGYAVDRLLELAPHFEPEQPAYADAFVLERRCEQRFPRLAQALPSFVQGYDRSRESAAAILSYLEKHAEVNLAIAEAIRGLCRPE